MTTRIKELLREPIIIFLLLGIVFYVLHTLVAARIAQPEDKRIVVSPDQVEQLAARFSNTWMRQPTEEELEGLVQNHIRDEVYYREALEMGLDKNDQMIRQRLRQKLENLMDDLATANVPTDQVLNTYMQENADKFRTDPQVSFLHVYLNPDRRKDIEQDAKTILAQLQAGTRPEEVGDPNMLGYVFERYSKFQVGREFGNDFADQVVALPPGEWTGPIFSGLGGHIIKVTERIEGRMPKLQEIRPEVEREWLFQRSKEVKDAAYQKLLEQYEVYYEKNENEI